MFPRQFLSCVICNRPDIKWPVTLICGQRSQCSNIFRCCDLKRMTWNVRSIQSKAFCLGLMDVLIRTKLNQLYKFSCPVHSHLPLIESFTRWQAYRDMCNYWFYIHTSNGYYSIIKDSYPEQLICYTCYSSNNHLHNFILIFLFQKLIFFQEISLQDYIPYTIHFYSINILLIKEHWCGIIKTFVCSMP